MKERKNVKKFLNLIFIFVTLISTSMLTMAVEPEKRTLEQLYQAALKEGGKLVLYAGGFSVLEIKMCVDEL